jgi:hypothetical protein
MVIKKNEHFQKCITQLLVAKMLTNFKRQNKEKILREGALQFSAI